MGKGTDANEVTSQQYDLSGTTGRRGHHPTHHNGGRNSRDIQHNIEITRAELDETVTAIQQKLSLEQWTRQAFDMLRDNARHGAPKVLDAMRANPMPTALMAFGLGWLIMRATGTGPGRPVKNRRPRRCREKFRLSRRQLRVERELSVLLASDDF